MADARPPAPQPPPVVPPGITCSTPGSTADPGMPPAQQGPIPSLHWSHLKQHLWESQ